MVRDSRSLETSTHHKYMLGQRLYNLIAEHLEHNDLTGIYQSAYRLGHSTETALLKMQ